MMVDLSVAELSMLTAALEAYEYWQLSDSSERDSGFVFIPGDVTDPEGKMFIDPEEVSDEDAERYEKIKKCRDLEARLQELVEQNAPAEETEG